MKTIVAPTDFSPVSLNAVYYAADMARVTGCSLSLLHITSIPVVLGDAQFPVFVALNDANNGSEKLESLKNELHSRTNDEVKIYAIIREGNIVTEIRSYCKIVQPYSIVMGAETAGGLGSMLGNAFTIDAIKELKWPVIVVPEDARFTNIRTIGLACDFKDVPNTIPIEEIRKIVNEFGAELHVLHVSETASEATNPESVEQGGWLQEMLFGLNPSYHFINNIDIEKGIDEFVEKNNFDMLIVVPKKHDLLHKLFAPSWSNRLVLHSHVPILAVHEE